MLYTHHQDVWEREGGREGGMEGGRGCVQERNFGEGGKKEGLIKVRLHLQAVEVTFTMTIATIILICHACPGS